MSKKIIKNMLNKKNPGLYNKILQYIKCYGGYVAAIGAGCLFGVSFKWGLGFLLVAAIWAYKVNCNCRCTNGTCKK